jgi:hypothetical protein
MSGAVGVRARSRAAWSCWVTLGSGPKTPFYEPEPPLPHTVIFSDIWRVLCWKRGAEPRGGGDNPCRFRCQPRVARRRSGVLRRRFSVTRDARFRE